MENSYLVSFAFCSMRAAAFTQKEVGSSEDSYEDVNAPAASVFKLFICARKEENPPVPRQNEALVEEV